MNVAKYPFAVLQIFGAWKPESWTSKWATFLYAFYSFSIIITLFSFLVSLSIYILRFSEDIDSLTQSLLMFCSSSAVIMKMLNIILNHEKIIAIDKMFSENICISRDSEEKVILKEYEYLDRVQTISLLTLCFSFVIYIWLSPLLNSSNDGLPFMSIWIPFSMESRVLYWLVYFYQALIFLLMSLITCSVDLYVVMIMKRVSTQLVIFKHRLLLLPKLLSGYDQEMNNRSESRIMKDWIFHHIHLFAIEKKLNDIFSLMIFLQFFISTSALSLIIFHLANLKLVSTNFWFMIVSLTDFMIEIFFYCWYGEEMICKSTEIADSIYEMDWNLLSISSKKCLIVIMIRARQPIQIVGGSIVKMSADTLVMILKAAYSAFSVLKTSSD